MNALVESWWVVIAGLAAYGLRSILVDTYGKADKPDRDQMLAVKFAPLAGFILFLFLIFSGNSE